MQSPAANSIANQPGRIAGGALPIDVRVGGEMGNGKIRSGNRGFSLIELVVVLGIALVMFAIALPSIRTSMDGIRHRNAVAAATNAIQATRYQALRDGRRYAITFNPGAGTYQVSAIPAGGAAFVNVGGPIPLGNAQVSLDIGSRLEFAPNGTVTATAGALTFNVQYGTGSNMKSHAITVSRVGHVTVQ